MLPRRWSLATCIAVGLAAFLLPHATHAQAEPRQLAILDTDIGDDVDDAYALGLLLNSPSIRLLGITADWGETALRARMLDRFLAETGHTDIPVFTGPATTHPKMATFSQRAWAERAPEKEHGDAIDFLLRSAREHPGEVTVIAVGPLTNLAEALKRDPEAFRKLRRIVCMGGSVRRGYGDPPFMPAKNRPSVEYNIHMDIPGAQAVFQSGVPLVLLPLDSTQIPIDETKRRILFSAGTPLTDILALLTQQWMTNQPWPTPTAFDAVAALWALDPATCPSTPLRLEVDGQGFTREISGKPNTEVCLENDSDRFFRRAMPIWLEKNIK